MSEIAGLPMLLPHVGPDTELRAPRPDSVGATEFEDALGAALESANTAVKSAEHLGEAFAAGARDDIHGTMLALSKADIELRFLGNVRNRVIDAFYELWRMQV